MLKLKMESQRANTFCQRWKQSLLHTKDSSDAVLTKRLVDVDWKFGVTASNDSLARVGNCYLQV